MNDLTPVMEPDDLQYAQELSIQGLRPPLHVPGYEQETFLGKGAFGEVWRAIDSNNGRQVVIKFYNRRSGLDWSLLAREVEKLRYLFSDRYVVQLFDVGWDATPPYYVMEYMENGSLEEKLRAGPLPVDQALAMIREIAVGLVRAHGKGIIHCDLKPANILLDQDDKPRLADFGQSRLSHEHMPALGTLFYMPAEQADLNSVPDARWDVYALGAMLYHMLTGSPPYRGEPGADEILKPGRLEERLERYHHLLSTALRPRAHRHVRGVDAMLTKIIDRCLAPNPKRRFPNVQSVLSALDARTIRRSQRPLLVLGAVGPALVVLVLAVIAGWQFEKLIDKAETGLIGRAEDSNRLTAQSLADRFALEVDRRWRILEHEATDPALIRMLDGSTDPSADPARRQALQTWISQRHSFWNSRFGPETAATYWFVVNRDGYLCLLSPPNEAEMGRYLGYRDYFHGLGYELKLKPDDPRPRPITHAYRSMVYESKATDILVATFSVPIWSHDPGRREPIGVLAMEIDMGHFTRFQGTWNQFAVLIDLRPDANGRKGLIVEHPYLDDLEAKSAKMVQYYVAPPVVECAERLRRAKLAEVDRQASPAPARTGSEEPELLFNYTDPVGGEYQDKWFAVMEPVIIPRIRKEIRDSGWVVLVQERPEKTLQPLWSVEKDVKKNAIKALLLVVLVITGLWIFVLLVLREGRSSRLPATWRRWRGLPSIGSSTHASGSLKSQPRSEPGSIDSGAAEAPEAAPGSQAPGSPVGAP